MHPFGFRIAEHEIERDTQIVEIIQDGEVVGAIYPTERGIKIISRYLFENPEGAIEIERGKLPPIPAILINLI